MSNRLDDRPGAPVAGGARDCVRAGILSALLATGAALAPPIVAAQDFRPADEPFREAWRWVQFGPESGLPPGRPLEIVESDSTSWLATDLAIAWFDGFEWRRLDLDASAPRDLPRRLTPDGHGGLLGIANGSVMRVTRAGVARVALAGLPAGSHVRTVVRLADDDLLLLIDSTIVRHHDGVADPVPAPAGARAMLAEQRGRLLRTRPGHVWLLGAGAWRWTGRDWETWFDGSVGSFRESEAGGLLSTTAPPFMAYAWMPGGRPQPATPAARVVAMSISPAGEAVMATSEGRLTYRSGGTWTPMGTLTDPAEGVRQMQHRDNGDLWVIGTRGVFLYRSSSDRWSRWRVPGRGEVDGFVNAILPARSGALWLGMGRGLVRRDTSGAITELDVVAGHRLAAVTALAEDTAGGIWIGSGDQLTGAYRWDGATWTRFGAAEGLTTLRVHRIVPGRRGDLWFLGIDTSHAGAGGAFRWDGQRFTAVDELADRRVYAFAEASDGTLWFGSDQGLSRRRGGVWTHWPATPEGVGARVYTVAVDSANTVWFGHWYGGLGLGRIGAGDRVERADIGEIGPRYEVTEVRVAPDQSIWFLTHGGIGRIRDGTLSFLDREAGLVDTRVWPLVTLADRMLIGADGLLTLRLPDEATPPPRVRVDAPLGFGSEVLFRWTPLAWWGGTPSSRIETRFRVNDAPWSDWDLSRQVALYGLPPGPNRFEVQAKGLFGRLGPTAPPATLDVPWPWYRRWEFLVPAGLAAAAFALLIALYARRRVEHRRALEQLNRALAADVEERRRAEAALEESRRVLQGIADSVPSILFLLRVRDTKVLFVNRAVEFVLGYTRETMTAAGSLAEFMTDDVRQTAQAFLERLVAAGDGAIVEGEAPMNAADGRERTLAVRATVFARDDAGRPESMLAVAHDVTDERRLEAQLLQAQKMETVGRLAGGVAHDFNNILTAIAGYAELAREGVDPKAQTAADIDEIARAADRARLLTMQLLTFARRQMVEPQLVDLNALVAGVERMLVRLIGEDVELTTDLADGLWPVRIDPTQLEQVLINLAVNARDAMPGGGRLTIATANADRGSGVGRAGERIEGPCVILRVRDSGHGMTADVAAHAFEPFYTTKDPGKGTGLGLSTCYGIVSQAGGLIDVASAPGAGTTFTIALPRAQAGPELEVAPGNGHEQARGSELVLLVEDEEPVRRLATRVLREAGYDVMAAGSGREALDALAASNRHPPALLLSDVVMPEMSGPALWAILQTRHPELKVLFMSGYTESTVLHQGVADRSLPFLAKPFTGAGLAAKVREVLDS